MACSEGCREFGMTDVMELALTLISRSRAKVQSKMIEQAAPQDLEDRAEDAPQGVSSKPTVVPAARSGENTNSERLSPLPVSRPVLLAPWGWSPLANTDPLVCPGITAFTPQPWFLPRLCRWWGDDRAGRSSARPPCYPSDSDLAMEGLANRSKLLDFPPKDR